MHVELPPLLTYAWDWLLERPQDGAWSMFFSEWVALVGAAFLWEVYSSARLFWLPTCLIEGIRAVNLQAPLGADAYAEVLRLLYVVETQDWATVSATNRLAAPSGRGAHYARISRADGGGEWIHYDPVAAEIVSEDVAHDRRRARMAASGVRDAEMAPIIPASGPRERVSPDGAPSVVPPSTASVMDYEEESIRSEPPRLPRSVLALVDSGAHSGGRAVAPASVEEPGRASKVARVGEDASMHSSASSMTRHMGCLDLAKGLLVPSSGESGDPPAPLGAIDTDAAKLAFMNSMLRSSGLLGSVEPKSLEEAMGLLASLKGAPSGPSIGTREISLPQGLLGAPEGGSSQPIEGNSDVPSNEGGPTSEGPKSVGGAPGVPSGVVGSPEGGGDSGKT